MPEPTQKSAPQPRFKRGYTHIIAELGNIHLHDKDSCEQAVHDAFSAGADLVKLQCINPFTAYWASKAQHERYVSIYWPMSEWEEFLGKLNKQYDGKVFVSPFCQSFIPDLSHCLSYWKVAKRMHNDEATIAKMIWSGKPIFFSTNGKDYPGDKSRYFDRPGVEIYPLYATDYNVRYDRLAPKVMDALKKRAYAGVSINFGGEYAINLAKSLSSCQFIEVHVKGANANGPDAAWSLSMSELEEVRGEIV